MANSMIDGTIEDVQIKRATAKLTIFDTIKLRLDNGSERTLVKNVATSEVADALKPGASGRFYLYSAIDHKGVHGFRPRAGGKTIFGYPLNNERIMLVVLIVNLIWLVGGIAIDGGVRLLALALTIMGAICYPLYRKSRVESQKQVENDSIA